MKRKKFLRGLGLTGVGAIFGTKPGLLAGPVQPSTSGACTLIPTETAGPFPLDLMENPTYFRQDVREDRAGVQLNMRIKVIGAENCEPMPNIRVNIWHCDKDGKYSGYGTEVGMTYLRGYQLTDINGEVEQITIFPGWYNGRICHIHFQCFVSSVYAAISQLAFPVEEKNALYEAHSAIYTKGPDPLGFNQDNVFSDGYALQLATLTPNADTGGYDSYLEVMIQGSGTTGLAALEPETGGQFKLGQNVPNPYTGQTRIPVTLTNASKVRIDLFGTDGKFVATVDAGKLAKGSHEIPVGINNLGIPLLNYVYQLQVVNEHGTFRQGKLMTAAK
jgi:protocatechuate 3,4-dioxygenase beta subunit